jgi:hypothetical protein
MQLRFQPIVQHRLLVSRTLRVGRGGTCPAADASNGVASRTRLCAAAPLMAAKGGISGHCCRMSRVAVVGRSLSVCAPTRLVDCND